uniref:Endonuclease/exonuclease/phosphatase domain-containing protein n=1 Tax=viral metagenome TaxID=1070528 RepID=A0A6C0J242_9ZZZZ
MTNNSFTSFTSFTLLSYNMDCSSKGTNHEKILKIIEITKETNASVILLQAVNMTTLSILKSKLVDYNTITNQKSSNSVMQVIFLNTNNCQLIEEYCYDMPTLEEKEILGCKMEFNNKTYDILNVHLEDNDEDYRKKQIEVLYEISEENNSIISGEFNIYHINEPASLSLMNYTELIDPWITNGCNTILRDTSYKDDKWYRTSRILYFKNSDYICKCYGIAYVESNLKNMLIYEVS